MKKITFLFLFTMCVATAVATTIPVQYHKQRSLKNTASLSEVQNLQVFLSGAYSLVGFEGAPRTFVIDVASPLVFGNRRDFRGFRQNVPIRNFVGGTIEQESLGVHTHFRAMFGYSHRIIVGQTASLSFGVGGGVSTISSNFDRITNDYESAIRSIRETSFAYRFGARFDADRLSVSVFNNDNDFMGEIVWGRLWNSDPRAILNNHGGFSFNEERERRWNAQTAVLFRHNTETKLNVVRFSANATNGGFAIGISYQTDGDLSANVSLRLSRQLRIGYAYQLMSLNPMARKHEIVVKYRLVRSYDDRRF